jgi:hypothetical protein
MSEEGSSKSLESESQPFLNNESQESFQRPTKSNGHTKSWLLLHLALITTYTVICIVVLSIRPKFPSLFSKGMSTDTSQNISEN